MAWSLEAIKDTFRGWFLEPATEEDEKQFTLEQKRPALLDLIADKESRGNYKAYFGKADNESIDFTQMSVRDVRKWQDDFVSSGSRSSAVGRYQIIRKTMDSLIDELNLTGDELFDEAMQDKMAITLANRRGYSKWKEGKLSTEKFGNNIAKEWASFPVFTPINGRRPGESYYKGDGLNKALISVPEVMAALEKERQGVGKA